MPKNKGNSGWRLMRSADGTMRIYRVVRGANANNIKPVATYGRHERDRMKTELAAMVDDTRIQPKKTEEAS